MPLDLSLAVDKEVYSILSGLKSGVEAKHFLCSAVLYYARSPLVLSANALTEKLDEVRSVLSKLDFSYTGLQLEKILAKLDGVELRRSVGRVDSEFDMREPRLPINVLDPVVTGKLSSLKDKFKV
jgi:hypothetical protein